MKELVVSVLSTDLLALCAIMKNPQICSKDKHNIQF